MEPEWLRKQKWERATAKSIKWVSSPPSPSPELVREGLGWISANVVKSNETVQWKKVSQHFIVAWNLCGEDVEEVKLFASAWMLKLRPSLQVRYERQPF